MKTNELKKIIAKHGNITAGQAARIHKKKPNPSAYKMFDNEESPIGSNPFMEQF